MNTGEQYRVKAAEFDDAAKAETNPHLQAEFERLAHAYRRLADQAPRSTDIASEPPSFLRSPAKTKASA